MLYMLGFFFTLFRHHQKIQMAETVPDADVDSIIERLLEGHEYLL